jgi:hypothetical protein
MSAHTKTRFDEAMKGVRVDVPTKDAVTELHRQLTVATLAVAGLAAEQDEQCAAACSALGLLLDDVVDGLTALIEAPQPSRAALKAVR